MSCSRRLAVSVRAMSCPHIVLFMLLLLACLVVSVRSSSVLLHSAKDLKRSQKQEDERELLNFICEVHERRSSERHSWMRHSTPCPLSLV